jgi:mannitol/fructose-specific phosphotransferase system IIA component (Ntr-type)
MQKVINQLVQLQELTFARAEQDSAMEGGHLAQLDQSIESMIAALPEDIQSTFVRMLKKSPLAIVPVSNKNCSACNMSLTLSLVQAVRTAERLNACPNCGRLLYYTTVAPRQLGSLAGTRRRSEPPKVGIERFSSVDLMIPRLEATDRDGAIAEIAHLMEEKKFIDSGSLLTEEALKREAIVSTAVDHGLAFPHVRGVDGGGLTLALGISEKGIKFGGASRTLTRIIFFMTIPTAASAFYLKLLSGLTQAFRKEEAREKLLACDQPDELWKQLVKLTKTTIT